MKNRVVAKLKNFFRRKKKNFLVYMIAHCGNIFSLVQRQINRSKNIQENKDHELQQV